MKSYFFFEVETGAQVGQFVLPRDQTLLENCTIHNFNVVPTYKGYYAVSGNYQKGISVIDRLPQQAVWVEPSEARKPQDGDQVILACLKQNRSRISKACQQKLASHGQ